MDENKFMTVKSSLKYFQENDYDHFHFNTVFDPMLMYDANRPSENDKEKQENTEKICKVYEQGYEVIRCNYRAQLKNASESAEKSNKMNDEERKQFIDGTNKIDKILNQAKHDDDKETLLKDRNEVCKKLTELFRMNGVKEDPEYSKFKNMAFEAKIPRFFADLYKLDTLKHGKESDGQFYSKFYSNPCAY